MKCTKYYFLIIALLSLIWACNDYDKIAAEIEKISVDLQIERFDRKFAQANAKDLFNLKEEYPYLFPSQFSDSLWIAKMESDTLQKELEVEVLKVFPDFETEALALQSFYKHLKYYFPEVSVPKVVTVISEVDYNNRIILSDSLLLIGLDNYLGANHKFYGGFSNYIAESLEADYLLSDVASAYTRKLISYPRDRSFLSRMVYYGKELYLKELLIPLELTHIRFNYSEEDYNWAIANEEQIWRFFVENELLYSTDSELDRRFLDPAPFSKFGLELDSESPSRLGRFMGYQIVKAYMDKNGDTKLQNLLAMPANRILKESNYKPKK